MSSSTSPECIRSTSSTGIRSAAWKRATEIEAAKLGESSPVAASVRGRPRSGKPRPLGPGGEAVLEGIDVPFIRKPLRQRRTCSGRDHRQMQGQVVASREAQQPIERFAGLLRVVIPPPEGRHPARGGLPLQLTVKIRTDPAWCAVRATALRAARARPSRWPRRGGGRY